MEDAKSLVRKLLTDPYKKILLSDYNQALTNRKNRKKLEEIEKEVSWFNGKAINYRVEDRQGFFNHFKEHYSNEKAAVSGTYRPINDYPGGQEPKILFFILLYVKKQQDMQDFQAAHPLSDLKSSLSLAMEYKKMVNEYRLLTALLERLSNIVEGVIRSIDELTVTDYLKDAESLSIAALQSRFYRAVRGNTAADVCEQLLELIKKDPSVKTLYMDCLLAAKKKEYEKVISLAQTVPTEDPSYRLCRSLMLEASASLGNIELFAENFAAVSDTKMDAMYFIYLLQTLVCNADYSKLDTEDFENAVQDMLKNEFNQNANPAYVGLVTRKFVTILLQGLPLAEKLLQIKRESGEDAIPEEELNELYRLQMALQLYPVEEVGNLIDMDYLEEQGSELCRKKLGHQAISMLIEKNPDKSFENIFLAFTALDQMGMKDSFVNNIESNLENLVKYGKSGYRRAYLLIKRAYDFRTEKGEDASNLEAVLQEAGILTQEI